MKRKPSHISQEDWDAVDIPPLTDDQLKAMRPVSEVLPFFKPIKKPVSIRLDADVLAWFKSQEGKYQARINEALREYMREHQK